MSRQAALKTHTEDVGLKLNFAAAQALLSGSVGDPFELLGPHVDGETIILRAFIPHALGVEAVMRAYARQYNGDADRWGMVGLLHDFDYERYPSMEDHPLKGSEILKDLDYPDDIRYAILCHAPFLGYERKSLMDKAILAVDELVGFITAVTLVQPSKRVADVKVSSVKKKLKDKAFARSVNREDIYLGMTDLGITLDDHIAFTLQAMTAVSAELGL